MKSLGAISARRTLSPTFEKLKTQLKTLLLQSVAAVMVHVSTLKKKSSWAAFNKLYFCKLNQLNLSSSECRYVTLTLSQGFINSKTRNFYYHADVIHSFYSQRQKWAVHILHRLWGVRPNAKQMAR